jgi:hypothetical protein
MTNGEHKIDWHWYVFHKGWTPVIETAMKEVDELIVLIYDDPILNIP